MREVLDKREKVKKAINLYTSGYYCNEISKQLGVSASSIRNWLNNENIKLRKSPAILRKFPVNDTIFNKIDNEEKAYWLGFLYADGCIHVSKYSKLVKLSLAIEDINHIEKFKKFIEAENKIYISTPKNLNHSQMATLTISSNQMVDDLIRLGCMTKKTFKIKMPDSNIVPDEFIKHFIRGYFDGDGGISITLNEKIFNCIVNITSTIDLCQGIIDKINKAIPIHFLITQRHKESNTNTRTISVHGNRQCLGILNYLYGEASIFLERKLEIVKRFISIYNDKIIIKNFSEVSLNSDFTLTDIKNAISKLS